MTAVGISFTNPYLTLVILLNYPTMTEQLLDITFDHLWMALKDLPFLKKKTKKNLL